MIREICTIDFIKGVRFISAIENGTIKLFSLDEGISLYIEADENTRNIKSIRINGKYFDVTMKNINALNNFYSKNGLGTDITITEPTNTYIDKPSIK